MQRQAAWWRGAVGGCTESLGSDSGDAVGYADADIIAQLCRPSADEEEAREDDEPIPEEEEEEEQGRRSRRGWLPPVMPRASEALVMRAERGGGRLVLTEVRADEHQRRCVFRASRGGGRLQLCFADAAAGGGGGRAAGAGAASDDDGGDDGDDDDDEPEEEEATEHGAVAAPLGGELCQVAAAGTAGRGRVEVVGAVVGI